MDILAVATILGGVAAVWFFWDKIAGFLTWAFQHFRRKKQERAVLAEQQSIEEAKARLAAEGEGAVRGLAHHLLHPFLAWYYGVELWTCDGESFPAVVIPVDPERKVGKDGDVLEPWNPSVARASIEMDWACADRSFAELRTRANRKVENRQTFCLERIHLRDQVPVVRGNLIGYYEDCLATCDAMERELLLAFASDPPKTADIAEFDRFVKTNLPLRNAAKTFCADRSASPYLTGIGRSAAIAVSTLTFAKKPDGSVVTFLGHRSGKTAAHPHFVHVAPSGMFQPIWHWQKPGRSMDSQYYSTEWNLRNHVLRELAEELFGRDIDSDLARQSPETPDVIFGYPEVKHLDELITSGRADLFVVGVLVNLLNLRPEIATVLIIDDPTWYEQHSQGTHGLPRFARNWEFLDDNELQAADFPTFWHSVVWTPTEGDRSQDLRSRLGGVTSRKFVVPGAITFLLGLRFARSHWILKS